jgi:hypothetical protein
MSKIAILDLLYMELVASIICLMILDILFLIESKEVLLITVGFFFVGRSAQYLS